jgi:hypothetical protein
MAQNLDSTWNELLKDFIDGVQKSIERLEQRDIEVDGIALRLLI